MKFEKYVSKQSVGDVSSYIIVEADMTAFLLSPSGNLSGKMTAVG